jgi:methionine synthase I (cobalamin-dependent)
MTAEGRFRAVAAEKIMIFDGGYGTSIQKHGLTEADYRGSLDLPKDQKGNNDLLCLTRPDIVEGIHAAYLDAGADMIETNTFSSTKIAMADYGCEHLVRDINIAAAKLARAACEKATAKDGRPRFVAGSIGPTNKTLSISPDVNDPAYREVDYDTLKADYREQCDALIEGGVDFLLVETCFDTLNAKAAGMAAREAEADTLILAYPNAGLPNELGQYDELPETTASLIRQWVDEGLVNMVGGCCGTTPAHIGAVAKALDGHKPRVVPELPVVTRLAGLEPMHIAA